jgi:hypothetical protein
MPETFLFQSGMACIAKLDQLKRQFASKSNRDALLRWEVESRR